jgi:hypothetical protein
LTDEWDQLKAQFTSNFAGAMERSGTCMDLAMVMQEQGETLRQYMQRFFDKRAIVVDIADKEVINLFQNGLYHHRTFEDFSRRHPSSITKLLDMITSWANEEDKANAKYGSIRGKSKHNTGSNNNNNNNNNNKKGVAATTTTQVLTASVSQTTQSWLYNALRKTTRKRPLAASKTCSKEKCSWHLEGNHTTEQCYQLRQALKDTPNPRPPHDKKGKKKVGEGNNDFQVPEKTVNVLFGGLPTRRSQKATRQEVLNIEPVVPTPLRWSEVSINFSRADQWTSFSELGHFSLVLKPVVAGSRLNKVLIDGGSGLNVLFTKTLKKMKLDITNMLTKSASPFYVIVPGNATIPLGSVSCQLPSGDKGELPHRVHQV